MYRWLDRILAGQMLYLMLWVQLTLRFKALESTSSVPATMIRYLPLLPSMGFILSSVLFHEQFTEYTQNWSPQPFFQNVGSWYWGHGRLGPYSIVWFDFLSENGTNTVSAYISKLGKTIVSSCELGSITVRPSGGNDTYPPTIETGNPGGFRIVVKTDERGEDLTFNVKTDRIVLGAAGAMYTRWTGRLSAEIGGRRLEGGQALFEQFKLSA